MPIFPFDKANSPLDDTMFNAIAEDEEKILRSKIEEDEDPDADDFDDDDDEYFDEDEWDDEDEDDELEEEED